MWVLIICAGISWAGCGIISKAEYPSEDSCYRALESMRFDVHTESEKRRSAYAYCSPVPEQKEKGDG